MSRLIKHIANNALPYTLIASIVLFLAFVQCSCRTQHIDSSTDKQTTIVSERYDSVYTVAGDSATAAMLFRCDSLGNVYLANLNTEQGKRMRLELLVTTMQERLDSTNRAQNNKPTNQPMYVQVDCKEDSFEVVIRGLRERITYIEQNKQTEQVEVCYIPKFYRNCTAGFWTLLALILISVALLLWKNWGKVRTWWMKIVARIIIK